MMTKKELQQFNSKWDEDRNGCWQWADSLANCGYGTFWLLSAKVRKYAHRVSYEHFKGAISRRHWIDHLCRNRGCVNPDHLEAVTPRANVLRGENVKVIVWRKKV